MLHPEMTFLPVAGFLGISFAAGHVISAGKGLLKKSSTGASNAHSQDAYNAIVSSGDVGALRELVRLGGFTSNGGWHGAVGKGADKYARTLLGQLVDAGIVVGPRVDPDHWYNNPNGWSLAPDYAAKVAPTAEAPPVNAVAELTEPLRSAAEQGVANVREAAAQTVERAGVGGGAALARKVRGSEGPLDKVIAIVKRPGGTVLAIGIGVGLIVLVTVLATRRRS